MPSERKPQKGEEDRPISHPPSRPQTSYQRTPRLPLTANSYDSMSSTNLSSFPYPKMPPYFSSYAPPMADKSGDHLHVQTLPEQNSSPSKSAKKVSRGVPVETTAKPKDEKVNKYIPQASKLLGNDPGHGSASSSSRYAPSKGSSYGIPGSASASQANVDTNLLSDAANDRRLGSNNNGSGDGSGDGGRKPNDANDGNKCFNKISSFKVKLSEKPLKSNWAIVSITIGQAVANGCLIKFPPHHWWVILLALIGNFIVSGGVKYFYERRGALDLYSPISNMLLGFLFLELCNKSKESKT